MIANPEVKPNYKAYERKIKKYEPTIDGIIEDFQDTVFGEFLNRRNRDSFIEMLTQEGWKYFYISNLNELFAVMLERHGTVEISDDEEKE